jgi:hypothetical protein
MSQREANPADATNLPKVTEKTRIPMSVPVARLAVQEIPGFHLHWFNGTPDRIARALQGGYEFVEQGEVSLNNRVLGSDVAKDGNTDMGTRVSQAAGTEIGADGQPVRLYLMKIKQEWWEADQKALVSDGSRLDNVRKALLGGSVGAEKQSAEDRQQTYLDKTRTQIPDFLKRRA